MPPRLRQPFAGNHLMSPIVVKPGLARFKTCHNRMPLGVEMLRGVLTGRTVATTDVAAFSTTPEMEPPSAGCKAVHAAFASCRYSRIDSLTFGFHRPLLI